MVSDEELVEKLREILRVSDLETATAGTVRRQLEDVFGENFSDRKVFIREQIDLFLQTLQVEENANPDDDAIVTGLDETADVEEEEGEEGDAKENIKSRKGKEVKKARGGFSKVCSLSPQLQAIVGEAELARTEVVKRLWAYIRENDLQDPKNRRNIICDDSLHALFRVNTINMFQMNKSLSKHIWPLVSDTVDMPVGRTEDVSRSSSEEENVADDEEDVKEDGIKEKETERKGRNKKRGFTNRNKQINIDAKKPRGFAKLCKLSPQLQELVGAQEMARTEVVKKLWSYIRLKDLQDPSNRRNILCDDSLRSLFAVESIDMFQMNKALSQHISPLNEEAALENSSTSEPLDLEQIEEHEQEDSVEPYVEEMQDKGSSDLLMPIPLSEDLIKFFGTGERMMCQSDAVERMWEYIKQNELQDPSDKRRVICDDKLRELLEVDAFHDFSISKLLSPHFVKSED